MTKEHHAVVGMNWSLAETIAVINLVEGGRREEEVCIWLRGNWYLPTVHKGNTPDRGVALLAGGWVEEALRQ